ncbi:MAG: class A beta-lactamase [Rhodanobacter sp.]
MNRRNLLKGAVMGAASLLVRPAFSLDEPRGGEATARLAALERRHGGRLGVAVLDSGSGRRIGHRADERFAMCSTFKLLTAAAVLARVDRGTERLERRVVFGKDALVTYSPVTSHRVGAPGMTMAELCHAAITMSDNTAGNLLLHSLGGPAGWTAYARSLGDGTSRLDRIETELNEARPGDPRDTTTPAAMLANLRALLLGTALSDASRAQLAAWLRANTTGGARLRAGLPAGWRVGDKTGSGAHAATNDVAIVWPPRRKPLLVTAYYAESAADADGRNAVLAEVGRIAASI